MLTLPDAIIPILQPFSAIFQHRTWMKAQVLLIGAILVSKLSDYVRLSVKGKCPPSELLDYHTTMRQLMSGVRST